MKKLMTMACMLMLALGLGACNTMKGAGKDIESGGEKIQGAASDTQKNMGSSSGSSKSSGSGTSKSTTGESSSTSGSSDTSGSTK